MQKQQRRRFKQIDPLDKRLAEEVERLRNEAEGTQEALSAKGFCDEPGKSIRRPI